jgi:anti-anti-sigma factor
VDSWQAGHLDVERVGDVVVVRLLGEHDMATAPGLLDRLRTVAQGGHGIVVDIGGAEFADVAVLRAMVGGDEALQARGRRLALQVGTASPVRRLLELARVQELFLCAGDRVTAIELARSSYRAGDEPA